MDTEVVPEPPSPPAPNNARAAWIVAGVMTAVALIAAMVAVSAVMRDDDKTRPPLGARRASFSRPVTGTVTAIDGTSFTVRETFPNGESDTTKVATDKRTTFRQSVKGEVGDLAVGDTIAVTGTTADSVLTAQRITETANQATVIRGEVPGGRLGGARPRVFQAGVGNMRIGEVTKIEGDTITLASLDGASVAVKTTTETQVRVNEKITLRDLKKGDKVRVFGATKGDNLVASEVTKGDLDDALVS